MVLSKSRVHICILDLGITDLKGDEFYLLRKLLNIKKFYLY